MTIHTVDVADVRRRHPVQDVIAAEGVELHRSGRGWMGCCPFHEDSTASLSVAGVQDRFHCFGCGASGDVIDFVGRLRGLGFRDAVAHLDGTSVGRMPVASFPGAHAPGRVAGPTTVPEVPRERALEVNAIAWQWFSRPVAHEYAVSYLRNHRSIDLHKAEIDTGIAFVGHTGHGWTTLVDFLRNHGVSDTELLGLDLAQRTRRGTLIDTLRDRLIVPVAQQDGRIAGFVGRDTSGHPRPPKYRNPTRTSTFDKASCLYRPTQRAVPDATVVVVEGALDALAITATAAAMGMTEQIVPVSTLGTTVSAAQARRVLRLSSEPPVIALDGDDAGREGALRWVDAVCRDAGQLALVASLPPGADPAEWLAQRGRDGLVALNPAQRHTQLSDNALRATRPHLPGRELAELACRTAQPVRAAIHDVARLTPRLAGSSTEALIGGVVAEMTRQGWNPQDDFSRALSRSLIAGKPPPSRMTGPDLL